MFIPVMFNDQCDEIHQLFLEYGAPLGPTAKELDPEISDLIRVCDVCFKMPENDAESVLNGKYNQPQRKAYEARISWTFLGHNAGRPAG